MKIHTNQIRRAGEVLFELTLGCPALSHAPVGAVISLRLSQAMRWNHHDDDEIILVACSRYYCYVAVLPGPRTARNVATCLPEDCYDVRIAST